MNKLRYILATWLVLVTAIFIGFSNCGRASMIATSTGSSDLSSNQTSSLSTLTLENGAPYTRSRNVAVSLFAPRATQMKLSDKPDCSDGTWEAFTTSRAWTLSQANADVTVYTLFKAARGNVSSCVSDTIMHDDVPPQVTFTTPVGFITNQPSMKVEWSATDAVSGLDTTTCVDPSAANIACASAVTVTASGDGTKIVKVQVKDKAGNTADYQYAWTLDMTPPTLTINQQPGSLTRDTTAIFAFTAADAGAGIDKVMCRKLPNPFQPCTSPAKFDGLADGSYTFEAYAVDKAGNPSAPTKSIT